MNKTEKRKPNRLKNFDYSSNGAYFITICAQDKRCVFGKIVGQGLAPAETVLSKYGRIAERQLMLLNDRYPTITIDKYIIMPNHIHFILMLKGESAGASPCPTVSDVICAYKSLTTRMCKNEGFTHEKIFQASFYDHIIRDEDDYMIKVKYIEENPAKWQEDKYFNNAE